MRKILVVRHQLCFLRFLREFEHCIKMRGTLVRWFCSITSCSGPICSIARRNSDFLEGMLMTSVAESLIIAISKGGKFWRLEYQVPNNEDHYTFASRYKGVCEEQIIMAWLSLLRN